MKLGDTSNPSPLAGEGGARRKATGGRGGLLLTRAKAMRSQPTEAERTLWTLLRAKRLAVHKFKRQQPIGPYIADFVSFSARLIVEADGSQHADSDHDIKRDAWLREQGFQILRLWNNDVLARRAHVADAIWSALHDTPLPPIAGQWAPPSPARGEGLEV